MKTFFALFGAFSLGCSIQLGVDRHKIRTIQDRHKKALDDVFHDGFKRGWDSADKSCSVKYRHYKEVQKDFSEK